jgi:hypothetical protein
VKTCLRRQIRVPKNRIECPKDGKEALCRHHPNTAENKEVIGSLGADRIKPNYPGLGLAQQAAKKWEKTTDKVGNFVPVRLDATTRGDQFSEPDILGIVCKLLILIRLA